MTNELPGMQDKSDLTGGQTDCDREAQEKMREFEQWYVENAFDYASNPIGSRDCALQRKAWKACAAQSAETIARLEKQLAGAQADNARLREALDAILSPEKHLGMWAKYQPRMPDSEVHKGIAKRALAQPLDTSALDAYVAKKMAWRPIETAPKDGTEILVWFTPHGAKSVRWTDNEGRFDSECAHWHVDDHKHGPFPVRGYCEKEATHWMPLPLAPDKQGENGVA